MRLLTLVPLLTFAIGCNGPLFADLPKVSPPTETGGGGSTKPEFQAISIEPNPAKAGDVLTISFTVDQDLADLPTVSVDRLAATFDSQTAHDFVFTYEVLGSEAEGAVIVQISGTNLDGLTTVVEPTVVLDFTPPVATTVTVGSSDKAVATFVANGFTISAIFTDSASTVGDCEVCVANDGVCDTEWVAGTLDGGTCASAALTCIDGQEITLSVRASDAVGNVTTALPVIRTCDLSPPVAGAVTPANNATATHVDGSFDLQTSFADAGVGLGRCEICVSSDGTCDGEWTSAFVNGGVCSKTGLTCTNGQSLTLNMRAWDLLGNGEVLATPVQRLCDTAAPTPGSVIPANTDVGGKVDALFDLSTVFSDGTGSGLVGCEYCASFDSICDSEWTAATLTAGVCRQTDIPCVTNDATVKLAMRATDAVGNVGEAAAVTRICDTLTPSVGTVTVQGPATATHVPGSFTVSAPVGGGGGTGLVSCAVCKATDGTCDTEYQTATLTTSTCSTSTALTCSDGETLTLNIKVTDQLGNWAISSTPLTRVCDTQAPGVGTLTPANNDDGTFVDGTFDLSTTFTDTGAGLVSGPGGCSVCVATDSTCDTEWVDATLTGGTCVATGLTCTGGANLRLAMRARDAVQNGWTTTGVLVRKCDSSIPSIGTVTPGNYASGAFVAPVFDLSTTFDDGAGSGIVSCEVCKSTDSGCDTEWAPATYLGGSCLKNGLTCTDGQSVRLNMRATDNVGNRSAASEVVVTCDGAVPWVAAAPSTNGYMTFVAGSFDASATFGDSGAGVGSCQICRSIDGTCDSEWTAGTLTGDVCSATGLTCTTGQTLTLAARARDKVQNGWTTTSTVTRVCDTDAPILGGVTPANMATATRVDGSFDLSATVSDAISGLAGCEYCVAVDPDTTCDTEWAAATLSGGTCLKTGISCTDGKSLTLNMRATDHVNNLVVGAQQTRTCDTQGPTPGTVTPANVDSGTYVSLPFNLSTSFSDPAGVSTCEYCKIVGGICDSAWLGATFAGGYCSVNGLSCTDGQLLTLNMRATDGLANVSTAVAVTRTCDSTSPTVGVVTPANMATATTVDGTFDISTTFSDARAGVASCEVCVATDGACDTEWVPAAFGAGSCTTTGRTCTNGQTLTMAMRAVDNVGNPALAGPIARTCDTQGPTPGVLTTTPAWPSHVKGTFDLSSLFSDTSGVTGCEYCQSTTSPCSSWGAGTYAVGACTRTALTCTDGDTVYLNMRATDGVGNVAAVGEVNRKCDTVAPTQVTGLTATIATPYRIDLSWSPTSDGGTGGAGLGAAPYYVEYDTDAAGAPYNGTGATQGASPVGPVSGTSTFLSGLLGCKTYHVAVYAIDAVGNKSTSSADLIIRTRCGGDGTFTAGTAISIAVKQGPVVLGDLNDDGILDLAVGELEDDHVRVYFGNGASGRGNGTFAYSAIYHHPFFDNPITSGILARDVNADGIDDLVLANNNIFNVFNGNGANGQGNGLFTFSAHYGTFNKAGRFAAGDFNFDGITDLVATYGLGVGGCSVAVCTGGGSGGRGNGVFACSTDLTTAFSPTATQCEDVVVGDFNFDGIEDIAVASNAGIGVLRGNGSNGRGDGTFAASATFYATAGSATLPRGLVTADFNADGILDLAAANQSLATVGVLLGDGLNGAGNGAFLSATEFSTSTGPQYLAARDVDADNILDLLVTTNNGSAGTLDVLLGMGTGGVGSGAFSPAQSFTLNGPGHQLAVGDLDADGITDVVVATDAGVSVLLGNGVLGRNDGTFTVGSHLAIPPNTQQNLVVSDLNADGVPDITTVDVDPANNVSVYLGAGNEGQAFGRFGATYKTYGISTYPLDLVLVDLNADHVADLVTAVTTSGQVKTKLGKISSGRGIGEFAAATGSTTAGTYPGVVLVGDFNADHIADIAVMNAGDGTVHVLLGNGSNGRGDGTLAAAIPSYKVNVCASPSAMAAADLNADAITDLVVVCKDTSQLSVLIGSGSNGRGNAMFAVTTTSPCTSPQAVAVGDFNADAIPDLALGCWGATSAPYAPSLEVLWGNGSGGRGNGTFGVLDSHGLSGQLPFGVNVADANNDGILDILVAANDVFVFTGNGGSGRGDGSFTQAARVGGGAGTGAFSIADIDSDGRLDLVLTAYQNFGNSSGVLILPGGGTVQ